MSKRPNLLTMDPLQRALEKKAEREQAPEVPNPPEVSKEGQVPKGGEVPQPPNPREAPKTPQTRKTPEVPKGGKGPIAPERDFMKVANSITREAIAAGLFVGKSKVVYDVLYARTRGAIKPTYKACMSKDSLMKATGIASDVTLRKNLLHLRYVGLIDWTERSGMRGGNEYTVLLPEEAKGPQGTQGPKGGNAPEGPKNQEGLGGLGTAGPKGGVDPNASTVYGSPNTSSKTLNTIDDEAYLKFRALVAKVTGIAAQDLTFNRTLEFLGETFERIAKRTTAISDPDALLETHLRREERRQPSREVPVKREVEAPTPAREFDLESSIREMRDYLAGGFDIEQFRQGYTDEQWAAITEGVKHEVSQVDSQPNGEA